MAELLERINKHLEFLMECTIEPSSVRMQTQKLIDEIQSHIEAPKSNADRIRQMTDEELADKLTDKCAVCAYHYAECETKFCMCEEGVLKWLKQEVREDEQAD